MIVVTGSLSLWTNSEASSHFLRVPEELADEIHAHSLLIRRGFGSVKVEASIGDVSWRTSLFRSKGGGYFLPVKIGIVRRTGIKAGDAVTVTIELL